jgi:hypothetical protein
MVNAFGSNMYLCIDFTKLVVGLYDAVCTGQVGHEHCY